MSGNIPLVSVIIPTYNQKDFVQETLSSVFDQTYENIEIIVCDDASTDGTLDIIYKCCEGRKNVKILPSLRNGGIANNINRALDIFRGKYLAWLGGDDVMTPGKIEAQVKFLEHNRNFSGVCHDSMLFNAEGDIGLFSDVMNMGRKISTGSVDVFFQAGYYLLPSSMMICGEHVGEIRLDNRLRYNNDWLFDIEYFNNRFFSYIDQPLVKYRRHSSNITVEPGFEKKSAEENLIAMSIVIARYPSLGRLAVNRYKHALSRLCFSSIRRNQYTEALSQIRNLVSIGSWGYGVLMLLLTFFFKMIGANRVDDFYLILKRIYKSFFSKIL